MSRHRLFHAAVSVPDAEIDLARTALLLAAPEYADLDCDRYLTRLDLWAAAAGERIGEALLPALVVQRLADYLHEEQGLRGNADDYDDPRNSFLNEVMDRRLGIPISLSVVWLEIARRLRLPIVGVGLPAHFIVKWATDDEEFLIDPFQGGRLITVEDCRARLRAVYGSEPLWRESYLARASNQEIIARMLRNLKASYLRRQDPERALAAIERLLLVTPNAREELRDLGLLRLQSLQVAEGMACLERYLQLAPYAHDAEAVEQIIRNVRDRVARWN